MAFGQPPKIPIHDREGGCLRRPRDKELLSERKPVPPVPRTQRAKPRANSCGALRKSMWSRTSGCPNGVDRIGAGSPTEAQKPSELRRPRAESPFSYARVNHITRERDAVENQGFEMGPRHICAEIKTDFSRGHLLGKEAEIGGMPWEQSKEKPSAGPRDHGRRKTLQQERNAADQALEWVPASGQTSLPNPREPRPRVNTLKREVIEASAPFECPGSKPIGTTSGQDGVYSRRSVLKREQADHEHFPTPRGNAGGYGKKNLLLQECPIEPKVAAC